MAMSVLDLNRTEKLRLRKLISESLDKHVNYYDSRFDLKFPSNPIEWAYSAEFLNADKLYKNRGQYYVLREFFQCYCPICSPYRGKDVFNVDEDELRKKDVLLEFNSDINTDVCPKCGLTKQDFYDEGLLNKYNTLLLIIGMRAGKTTLASIIMSFFEQYCIRVGNIRDLLDLKKVPFLELACIAVSAQQARDTIWAQFRALREGSVWYSRLKEQMIDLGYERDNLYDDSLVTEINNFVHGYKIVSLTSSSATIAGRTRAMFVIDELGRFDTTESKRSAMEVWRVAQHSLKTVRNIVSKKDFPYWLGSLIAIESPISVDDYGMYMYNMANMVPNMFALKSPTWEFNLEYTETDFKEDFDLDYYGAMRDFGADPPGAEIPFIEDWELFLHFVEDKTLEPVIEFEDTRRLVDNTLYVGKRIVRGNIDRGEWFLAGDAGKSRDTFALVGCKRVVEEGIVKMTMGFALHILPNASQRIYVDFTSIVDLILDICNYLSVVEVVFDYWNSESIVQELMKRGIRASQYAMSSVKVDDFFQFKNDAIHGKIKLIPRKSSEDGDPRMMDSYTRLYWELKRLNRSKDLKKVDHSVNSTSDLSECVVNCYRMIISSMSTRMMSSGSYRYNKGFGEIARIRRW